MNTLNQIHYHLTGSGEIFLLTKPTIYLSQETNIFHNIVDHVNYYYLAILYLSICIFILNLIIKDKNLEKIGKNSKIN